MQILKNKFIVLIFFTHFVLQSCVDKENKNDVLLYEQSKEISQLNQKELNELISLIDRDNYFAKKESSAEIDKILSLQKEFENVRLDLEKANRLEISKIVAKQNLKFENGEAFKKKYFKFNTIEINNLENLNDKIFKAYIESKISKFYVQSGIYVLIMHQRKQNIKD